MTAQPTFVPTPRLDYTIKHNQSRDDYQYYLQQQQREIDRQERINLEKYQENQRLIEKRLLVKEMEEIKTYELLAKQKGYYDYKYAYWVGTLVDQYI